MEIDAAQFGWALGVVVASAIIVSWTVKAIRGLIKNAKDFITETVGPKPDIQTEVKKALQNGGGEIIRGIMKSENALQSEAHKAEVRLVVNEAIRVHEITEERKLKEELERFRTEFATEEDRGPDTYRGPKRRRTDR